MPTPSPDLVFQNTRLVGSPTDLVFGDTQGAAPPIEVRAAATLANTLTVAAIAGVPVRTNITATLANTLTVTARGVYDNRVTPWLDQRVAAPQNPAIQADNLLRNAWGVSLSNKKEQSLPWALAVQTAASVGVVFDASVVILKQTAADWQLANSRVAESSVSHQKAIATTTAASGGWQLADTRRVINQIALQTGVFKDLNSTALWQTAVARRSTLASFSGASLYMAGKQFVTVRWQMASRPQPGLSAGPVLPPVDQPLVPTRFNADLLFECPFVVGSPTDLVFALHPCADLFDATATFYIHPARFYMTTHNLIAHRLLDMAAVPLYDCTLSADVGSFAWQFSASGPESLFAQLAPTDDPAAALPQRLQITLDGLVWVFMVESLKRSHSFGKRSISISGRSQTALVGKPWAREAAFTNAAAANAQQLASQALDLSGVALDWGITDWLVPANAWSFAGSRLAAVQAIANAAGGYVQSHRSAATLQVRHPYPPRPSGDSGGPWNWGMGATDVQLASSAVITSAIERRDGADINAVYASGTTQGVLALVKRTGTAGDKLGDLQTDALITDRQAAQQRGLAILGKAGAQYAISLELPVLTGAGQPGVIDVGSLVQVNDTPPWRGRVRSVQVQAAMPKARQTITLERHL